MAPEPEPEPDYEDEYEDEDEGKITLTDDYNEEAGNSFFEIAQQGGGMTTYSRGADTLPDDLYNILESIHPKDIVDIVFAIDATGSMKDDIQSLRQNWLPRLKEQLAEFGNIRLGLLFYRDYVDDWRYKQMPVKMLSFTDDFDKFVKNLNSIRVMGSEGGDIPEPVYEALYSSLEFYKWRDEAEKRIILIGDAPPHSKPRGTKKITKEMVMDLTNAKGIKIQSILVPDDNSKVRAW